MFAYISRDVKNKSLLRVIVVKSIYSPRFFIEGKLLFRSPDGAAEIKSNLNSKRGHRHASRDDSSLFLITAYRSSV